MTPAEPADVLQSLSLRLSGAVPVPVHQLLPLWAWLTLFLLAASLALLVYALTRLTRLGVEPLPVPWPTMLYPLEQLLQERLNQASLSIPARSMIHLSLLAATAGAVLTLPLQNHLLMLITALVTGSAPYHWVRYRIRRRAEAVQRAVLPALVHMAQLTAVGHHPALALSGAAPICASPVREAMLQAHIEIESGVPLPDALRMVASRCGGNFYLAQLAELVALHLQTGSDLTGALQRLAARLQIMGELQAEESARVAVYRLLTSLLLAAAFFPFLYWAVTGSLSLQLFVAHPLAQGVLLWTLISGLVIASLPYWLGLED